MLRRVLGVPLLVGYGLGVIIGAGIYVLVGPVIAMAGVFAPLSFLLAGLIAALTAVCYAELAARFPEAAGAAAYVKEAFGSDRLSRAIGIAIAAVTLTSTAAVARGSVGYVQFFVDLAPMPIMSVLVISSTVVACAGVRESVLVATLMTIVEVGGLLAVIAGGWTGMPAAGAMASAISSSLPGFDPVAVTGGAFLCFFAYIGFENMANLAEEARDSERTLPQALLISLGLSTTLYVLVSAVTVASIGATGPVGGTTPLLGIGAETGWYSSGVIAAVALIAVSNGVLIEILMLSRLLYGMARRGWLPAWLGAINVKTAAPVRATIVSGAAVLAMTIAFDMTFLAGMTSTITLLVFAVVNTGLWRLQGRQPRLRGFAVPRFVPPLAALLCLGLVAAQITLR